MKKGFLVVFTATIFMTGCVASHLATTPDFRFTKYPENNVVTTSSLGVSMLGSGTVTNVNSFVLYRDVAIFDGVIRAGEYHQIGIKDNHKVFAPKSGYGSGVVGRLSGDTSPAKPYVDGSTGQLCFLGALGTRFCSDEVKPDVVKVNVYKADSFTQELIYTGKVGEKIRFTYREFQEGVARPAFNVNVEYDLGESTLISYKGATVEVISATNQEIVYKVLKHFN